MPTRSFRRRYRCASDAAARTPRVEPEAIARADEEWPERERAPALARERQLEGSRRRRRHRDRERVAARRAELVRKRQEDVDAVPSGRRRDLDGRDDGL